ncbi:MAG: aminotransferase class I/II-fold pyridoxal phosphate-dependent enzyme [Alphaproteobacteria bacterium]
MTINNFYQDKLKVLKKSNLYRQLKVFDNINCEVIGYNNQKTAEKYISFASNDYLGLSQNKLVKETAIKAIEKYGCGAGSSRYITGNNQLYVELEKQLANFKKTDEAIVFSSGYACAIGVIPALVGEGDLVVADKFIHSCLLDGIKLSSAKLIRFNHNNLEHCQKILEQNRHNFKKCLLVSETVFSMDGDLGKISELLNLAKQFQALFLSDDAHGLGLDNFKKNQFSNYHLQMGTLSKAFGVMGGYICGEKKIIDYLRNFARSQIYSTALPPSVLGGAIISLKIIKKQQLAKKALANAQFFCELMNLPIAESAIVIINLKTSKQAIAIAKNILKQKIIIASIRPPTAITPRLRITFSANHTKLKIKKLAEILKLELAKNKIKF